MILCIWTSVYSHLPCVVCDSIVSISFFSLHFCHIKWTIIDTSLFLSLYNTFTFTNICCHAFLLDEDDNSNSSNDSDQVHGRGGSGAGAYQRGSQSDSGVNKSSAPVCRHESISITAIEDCPTDHEVSEETHTIYLYM